MLRKGIKIFINLVLTLSFLAGFSQTAKIERNPVETANVLKINWDKPIEFYKQGKNYRALSFENVSYYTEKNYLPYFYLTSPCKNDVKLNPTLQIVETAVLTSNEESCINKIYLTANFEIEDIQVRTAEKTPYMFAKLVPLRMNKETGKIEKLISYHLQWQATGQSISSNHKNTSSSFATSSVLANGKWYKIGTSANAIYKIDKNFLQNIGVDVGAGGIDPKYIKIYGNGGEILPEYNGNFRYDDLIENAIYVSDTDGVFDNNDYILFYGQAPGKWKYNEGNAAPTRYSYNKHYYSDTVFYFLTIDNTSPGKRLQPASSATAPTYTVNSFDDFQVHEEDLVNLVKSGRELYGENFDNTASYSFNFAFPNLQNDTIWLKTNILGRRVDPGTGVSPAAFDVNYPGGSYQVTTPTTCAAFDCDVGKETNGTGANNFNYNGGPGNLNITVKSINADQSGWINYLWINVRRDLTMTGNQMAFRDYRSIGPGKISQFNLQSSVPSMRIWNISDKFNITEQQTTFSANTYTFAAVTDSLKEFVAFTGSNYNTPSFSCKVPNQNLHAQTPVDYIIVVHPQFLAEAQKLADLHYAKEKYNYVIATPDQIYNEFSSGAQDITAIRQFVRMLYKNASATTVPKYLLLFGDGSYLQKDRNLTTNTNVIPTFETANSSSYISSKTSDDFYGFLDDTEGLIDCCGNPGPLDAIDIGIGRLPVHSISEADAVTNKIIEYYARKVPSTSCCDGVTANAEDWRNWVCLIADDANPASAWERTFLQQSEGFAAAIGNNKRYNIDKIYLDAYQVVSVPGGRRYPDVVTAINNRIARGALILGFSGHGGELGLTHEEVVSINQIQGWTNINNMPLFFTATCEFSRFDDPTRTSAGEYVILNGNGGGVGLFTTTRLAFASDGSALGGSFYPSAVNKLSNGQYPALGDIIKKTKFLSPDFLHFALLGDPATKLSYPKDNTATSQINSHIIVAGVNDSLKALGKYTVTGFIADTSGNKITSFNGTLYPSVFDKPVSLTTLDNSGNGFTDLFQLQKNVIYRGKTSVTKGDFQFSFIVPKDIFYNFGFGKISYFAQGDTTDAAGYYNNVIVGGTSSNPISDTQGPGVKLFMNTNQFVAGGITNDNPYIYAEISDSSGINTTGNGLGHDIVATIDANTSHAYVLNDYYTSDLNKYQSGKVKYQVTNLSEGTHHLNIKVWDILNNSSTGSTDFVVAKSAEVALAHVLNYPNPFSTSTKFFVEHNQACDYLTLEIQIFTITGHLVKTIMETVHNEGFRTEGIAWDGRDDFGDKLARGVYIYKISVKNDLGNKASKIEKLVILN